MRSIDFLDSQNLIFFTTIHRYRMLGLLCCPVYCFIMHPTFCCPLEGVTVKVLDVVTQEAYIMNNIWFPSYISRWAQPHQCSYGGKWVESCSF